MQECEYLIIGAGITGLTIAWELISKGQKNIVIIEKEHNTGAHASGRNSGVLHAGIYYTPDSLKAKFCVDGNRLLTEYCESNNLNLRKSGKVIVATDEAKLRSLYKLQERAVLNGVESRIIDVKELKKIEPNAYTYKEAIYSPHTSVFNPQEILDSIYNKLLNSGRVRILFNTSFINPHENGSIRASSGLIKYQSLINASGAFADKIAHNFGIGGNYKILPFLGTYSEVINEQALLVNGNIYPVPDERTPFLGVHFTRSYNGTIYIGPTAFPAIGRESYDFSSEYSLETFSILYRDCVMFFCNGTFRDNALTEIRKYFSTFLFDEARKMVPSLEKNQIKHSAKAGIRPQLVDWPSKELVMDFIVLEKDNTVHILNAISPAFSSSMSFAKHVVDEYILN